MTNPSDQKSYKKPDATAPAPPWLPFPHTIRKVFALGHSHVVTLPPLWCLKVAQSKHPFISCTLQPDGSLRLAKITE